MLVPQVFLSCGWRRQALYIGALLAAVILVVALVATGARLENIAIRMAGGLITGIVQKPKPVIIGAVIALAVAWVGIAGLCIWERRHESKG